MKGCVSIVPIEKPVRSNYVTKEQFQYAMRQYNDLMREQRNRNRAFSGGGRQRQQSRHPSGQWVAGGVQYTANPANDPNAQGGYYLSQTDMETGDKATAVYNADGTFADTKANKDWRDVPRQD